MVQNQSCFHAKTSSANDMPSSNLWVLRALKFFPGDVFTEEILPRLLTGLAKSAEAAGMEIQSCARKEDFLPFGIKPGACIDAELINKLWGLEPGGKDKNQRPNCLCCKSVDIGAYGMCSANCVYCYAWH
jgi:hypothetical protein